MLIKFIYVGKNYNKKLIWDKTFFELWDKTYHYVYLRLIVMIKNPQNSWKKIFACRASMHAGFVMSTKKTSLYPKVRIFKWFPKLFYGCLPLNTMWKLLLLCAVVNKAFLGISSRRWHWSSWRRYFYIFMGFYYIYNFTRSLVLIYFQVVAGYDINIEQPIDKNLGTVQITI